MDRPLSSPELIGERKRPFLVGMERDPGIECPRLAVHNGPARRQAGAQPHGADHPAGSVSPLALPTSARWPTISNWSQSWRCLTTCRTSPRRSPVGRHSSLVCSVYESHGRWSLRSCSSTGPGQKSLRPSTNTATHWASRSPRRLHAAIASSLLGSLAVIAP